MLVVLRLIVVILYDARRLRNRLRHRRPDRIRSAGTAGASTGTTGASTGTAGASAGTAGASAGTTGASTRRSGLRIIRIRQVPLRVVLCGVQFGGPLQKADDQTTLGLAEVVDHDAQIVNLLVNGVSKKGTEHAKGAAAHLPLRRIRDRGTLVDGLGEATDLGGVGADEVGIYFEIRTGHR